MNKLGAELWKRRSDFVQRARQFFLERDYVEIDTPHLLDHASLEPHLDPYEVEMEHGRGYLITSPEFSLKKVLGSGLQRIFEISHSYRAKERGPWHSREFLMLEWYARDRELRELIVETEAFITRLVPETEGGTILTITQWFAEQLGIQPERDAMIAYLNDAGDQGCESWSFEDLFFKCFLPTESALAKRGLVFLVDYPSELCAYAKVENGVAKRFEVYLNGIELANAYLEETDPAILRKRVDAWNAQRKKLSKPVQAIDDEFITSLSDVQESVSGIALGLDRLFAISEKAAGYLDIHPI